MEKFDLYEVTCGRCQTVTIQTLSEVCPTCGVITDGTTNEVAKRWPTPTANDVLNAGYMTSGGKKYPTLPGAVGGTKHYNPLTSSAAASPASPSARPASARARPTTAGSGPSSPVSFARLDPDGSWLKTCQGYSQLTLDGSLETYSETWPRAGMTRSGVSYRLPTWGRRTSESASSSWPTPTAAMEAPNLGSNKKQWPRSLMEVARAPRWPTPRAVEGQKANQVYGNGELTLTGAVKARMYPTPQSNDWKGPNWSGSGSQSSEGLATTAGGQLNPTWVEWLMGFPLGWTDLKD